MDIFPCLEEKRKYLPIVERVINVSKETPVWKISKYWAVIYDFILLNSYTKRGLIEDDLHAHL